MPPEKIQELLAFLNLNEEVIVNSQYLKEDSKKIVEEKSEPYLTRGQVAKLLQISLPTLHEYTKRGLLISYRVGSKVRYKASEIESTLKERNYSKCTKGVNHGK